jgi:hypothetical protein
MELNYPVVSFGKGNVMHFARNQEELTTCNSRGLKNGFYNNLVVFDSMGNKIIVKGAEKIKGIGALWGFNIFLNQKILVKLKFSDEAIGISLEDTKEKIFKALKHDGHFWNSDGSLKRVQSLVHNAKSHKELIETLAEEFYSRN